MELTRQTDCLALIRGELDQRRKQNPTYSLNAFARFLGVSPASLSQILSGKRRLTRKIAQKIASRCLFTPEKSRAFLASALGVDVPSQMSEDKEWQELQIDAFRSISDWRCYAILSLGDVRPNRADPAWIGDQLGVPVDEARDAFDRLMRLGLVERQGAGFKQSSLPLSTATARTSAITKYHRQNLLKAQEVLESEFAPIELFSAITMAVDETQLAAARLLIKEFRRRICELLETGTRSRVYTLSIQLFPISKGVT